MPTPSGALAGSRLGRLAQRSAGAGLSAATNVSAATDVSSGSAVATTAESEEYSQSEEHCELCNAPIPSTHRHLLELSSRELMCACRPCSLLFDRGGVGNGRYKLIPERRLRLEDFAMSEPAWEELRIPVEMAFFFHSSAQQRVLAYYPGPMGPTESLLQLSSWQELEQANPILLELEEDVEALLVNRTRGARRYWLVPLDECYGLVGLIRTRWRGLSGGSEVWKEIDRFFEELDGRARSATARR
jgi:hypothetical protein